MANKKNMKENRRKVKERARPKIQIYNYEGI